MEESNATASNSIDNIIGSNVVIETEEGTGNGRYDDNGDYIKNIEDLPDVFSKLTKFSTEKKLSPLAIIFLFKKIERPSRDDVYDVLKMLLPRGRAVPTTALVLP